MSRGSRRSESEYVRDDRRPRALESSTIIDGRVYIGNLNAKNYSYREISDWMDKYGKVLDVVFFDHHILVQFDRESEARRAIDRERGQSLRGARFDIRSAFTTDGSMSRPEAHRSKSPRPSDSIRSHQYERDPRDLSSAYRDIGRERSPVDRDRYIRGNSPDLRGNERPRNAIDDKLRPNLRPELSTTQALEPARSVSQPNNKMLASDRPSFDSAIVVMSSNLLNYAETIETKLQRQVSLTTHIIVLKEEAHANACIDDLEKKGVLYAFLVNSMNEKHMSCTLRILHGIGQEHRNMLLANALSFVARNFEDYQKQHRDSKAPAPKSTFDPSRIPPGFVPPDDKVIYQLHLLADSRMLTIEELNEVDEFIQKRIQVLDQTEGGQMDTSKSLSIMSNEAMQNISSKGHLPINQVIAQQNPFHSKLSNAQKPALLSLDDDVHITSMDQYQGYKAESGQMQSLSMNPSPNKTVQQALDALMQSKFRPNVADQIGNNSRNFVAGMSQQQQQQQISNQYSVNPARAAVAMNPAVRPLTPGLLYPSGNYSGFYQQPPIGQPLYRPRPPFQTRPQYPGF